MHRTGTDRMTVATLPDLPSPLAVVCHDAGAANLIFAWLRALAAERPQDAAQWRLVLDGPALRLLQARPVAGARVGSNLEGALQDVQAVLTGTGWASDLEHRARAQARVQGIRSLAVLDHWVNYSMRFERNGETVLPDQLWVTDPYAAAEAQRCFPRTPVLQQPNLYLMESVRAIRPLEAADDGILYLLEPVRAPWAGAHGGEFEALDFFAENVWRLTGASPFTLRLRPHPSDPAGKYDAWIARHAGLHAQLDDAASLPEAIARARWVVGAETFAMVVALAAGRQVVSTLPPWAHPCHLPHPEIIQLRDLVPRAQGTT
jgi:hypothetical protein